MLDSVQCSERVIERSLHYCRNEFRCVICHSSARGSVTEVTLTSFLQRLYSPSLTRPSFIMMIMYSLSCLFAVARVAIVHVRDDDAGSVMVIVRECGHQGETTKANLTTRPQILYKLQPNMTNN